MNGMETKKASPSKEKLLIGLFLNHMSYIACASAKLQRHTDSVGE